jgi:hypothetical protein
MMKVTVHRKPPVLLRPLPSKKKYLLESDYYVSASCTVPKGFEYNGASVPFFGWLATTTPFDPRVMRAALVHDWLYHSHQFDRKFSDVMFYQYLLLDGLGSVRAKLMYWAVRIAGWAYWKNWPEDVELIRYLLKQPDWKDPVDSK